MNPVPLPLVFAFLIAATALLWVVARVLLDAWDAYQQRMAWQRWPMPPAPEPRGARRARGDESES